MTSLVPISPLEAGAYGQSKQRADGGTWPRVKSSVLRLRADRISVALGLVAPTRYAICVSDR